MWCLQDTRLQKEGSYPLKQLPQGQTTPTTPINNAGIKQPIDDLTSSGEYQESSDGQSTIGPHSLPASNQEVASHEEGQGKSRSFSRKEKTISVVGSPNFVYLNAVHSSSVEVLPYVYATVDLSKKTKNRKPAESTSDSALVHTRRKSKSSDSILSGSPSGSPTFTHFAAFAASDADSRGFDDGSFSMIPPQKPCSERVSVARSSIVSQSEVAEARAQCATILPELPAKKGSYAGEVEALERTLSEVSHVSRKGK